MRMMIHSNATLTVQLKQNQARAFGISELKRVGTFGIDRGGHVSDAGMSTGIIREMRVGQVVNTHVPVSVFEVPQNEYGMLGVDWIRINRLVVDFENGRAIVGATSADATSLRQRLTAAGYMIVPTRYDGGRYVVDAKVGGSSGAMIISTASQTSIEPSYAELAGISAGDIVGLGNGPIGTAIPIYAPKSPVVIGLCAFTSPAITEAVIEDSYTYMGGHPPRDQRLRRAGTLGSDFLAAAHAVVDFGSGLLFVR